MRIEYICHSALLIETDEHKILTDPWLHGSAYCNQWHLFPKPINANKALEADVILFSHGHEDHLHHETLLTLNKKAKVFYPFQWKSGIKGYLNELGFADVVESVTYHKYKLSEHTSITYIANGLDSIIVIEDKGKVIVNINDALPANHRNIINAFVKIINQKWSHIDYLFCGYGSAAYFPNTVHCEGKNDKEVAEAREQMFAENFCVIVDGLAPRFVVPFAADWVLLNEEKRWINEVKVSKGEIGRYYRDVHKGTASQFVVMHSGDVIENDTLIENSPHRAMVKNLRLDYLIETELQEEIKSVNTSDYINEADLKAFLSRMEENITTRSALFSEEKLRQIKYTIILKDLKLNNCFFIDCSGAKVAITRSDKVNPDSILTIETTAKILNYCFGSEWGGDAIIIGYGVEINILKKEIIKQNLDIVCVRLLTRQPVASKQMKEEPFRAIKYFATNPLTTSWTVKQFVKGRKNVNKNPVNERDLWLNKSKCEICQVCDIPYLTNAFAEELK